MKMCSALAERNVEVTLLYPRNHLSTEGADSLRNYYGTKGSFKNTSLFVPNVIARRRIFAWLAVRRALRINAAFAYCRDIPSCYRAMRANLPALLETHALPKTGSAFEKLLPRIFAHSLLVKVITVTKAHQSALIEKYGLHPSKCMVLPDAADMPTEIAPIELNAGPSLKVGYVGSLLPGKGMELISRLPKLCPWAEFHVVGGNTVQVRRWREQLDGQPNIKLHGYVAPYRTVAYLKAVDVVLVPNQHRVMDCGGKDIGKFTSPLKLFEAMAVSKPIVASDLEVLREVLTHEKDSLLCEPESPDDWASALNRLRHDPNLRESLSRNAFSEFKSKYTWQRRAQGVVELLIADSSTLSNEG